MRLELEQQDTHAIARKVADLVLNELTGAVPPGEIMDVDELAAMLKVKKDWVYKQVQFKSIPHFKAGKLTRFRRKEIVAWIAEQSIPSTKAAYPRLKSIK